MKPQRELVELVGGQRSRDKGFVNQAVDLAPGRVHY